jgi:cation-transporting P-type ATPase 13A2
LAHPFVSQWHTTVSPLISTLQKSITAHTCLVPFVVTIVVALLVSTYMLFDPSESVAKFMQLTKMSWDFRSFVLVLGIGYIALAWTSENYLLPRLAKYLGKLKTAVTRKPKQRKAYKVVLEEMRTLQ